MHYYQNCDQKKSEQIISQTNTSLNKYCLPFWGFSGFKGPKATNDELEKALDFRSNLKILSLKDLPAAFEATVKKLNTSDSVRYTYS